MTIDEAIIHAEEKAKELREQAEQLRDIGERISNPKQPYNEPVKACLDCAEEHRQLAEWLKELKRMKRIISDTNQGSNQGDLISREALKKYKFTTQVCNGVEPEDVEVVPVATIDTVTNADSEMKEIIDIIHNTIYQIFDVCSDEEEVPMSDKDKLLLKVNKAICNNLKEKYSA